MTLALLVACVPIDLSETEALNAQGDLQFLAMSEDERRVVEIDLAGILEGNVGAERVTVDLATTEMEGLTLYTGRNLRRMVMQPYALNKHYSCSLRGEWRGVEGTVELQVEGGIPEGPWESYDLQLVLTARDVVLEEEDGGDRVLADDASWAIPNEGDVYYESFSEEYLPMENSELCGERPIE